MTGRFFLAQDNDTHWYIVPCAKEEEWLHWCDLDPNNEEAWDAPDFAKPVGGAPCLVTFSDPEIS